MSVAADAPSNDWRSEVIFHICHAELSTNNSRSFLVHVCSIVVCSRRLRCYFNELCIACSSFIPGLKRPFLQILPTAAFPFLLRDSLHGFPRLFTVTSEHIPLVAIGLALTIRPRPTHHALVCDSAGVDRCDASAGDAH